ncbi:MAG TPA: ModD protein [Sulfuricurvum kujiense]|uniref:Putative pyrophosphorylase ModD n=1 Tax=Sulfuricurvum kujiense TaxID=148813 RepID=A0A2D3WD43_9BACT|nr:MULTISPECIES: ModD protein [Sulfuricurvum]OHD96201.1 MAG: ModD protein [Sulfuricurvum sp. RIFOXYD12_FULL_44_77]DAB37825.1 MAG TPA: ModD protein [Sulfuricurvum kujiense]
MITLNDSELETLLSEDVPYGDLTTASLGISDQRARITFSTRERPLVVSCTEESVRLCGLYGLEIDGFVKSGTLVPPKSVFLEAHGEAGTIHRIWKSVQNLLDYASGISTYTREAVLLARSINPDIVVATTRKTTPFTKKIAIKAVESGGGVAHRLGLSESILIFDYHRVFFPAEEAFSEAMCKAKKANPEKKIVIEASDIAEALKFARLGADILQLEKLPLTKLADAVQILRADYPHITLIATGGISAKNIAEYAGSGVDMIVTSSPYSAQPADIKVKIEPL